MDFSSRQRSDALSVTTVAGPALVVAGCALCLLVWIVDPSDRLAASLRRPVAAVGLGIAALLLLRPVRATVAAHFAASIVAVTFVALGIVASAGAGGSAAVFVAIAVYAAYVLPRLLVLIVVAALATALAAALSLRDVELPALTWGVTMSTVAASAIVVRILRRRLRALIERLDAAARNDHLTGLLNRRGIDERLELEVRRARRNREPLSIIVGDLDGFKELNDTYGHAEGDRALQLVAEALRADARESDAIGRLGGDEFVVLLPCTNRGGARVRAMRLQGRLARTASEAGPVEMSVGVAVYPDEGADANGLLRAADAALYRAKGDGEGRRGRWERTSNVETG